MTRRFTVRHLLAALAWLGLALAPLATPAAAMAVPMEMAAASVESSSTDMPQGMPCCPDQPAKPDCAKDCPFLAVCGGMVFPAVVVGAMLPMPLALLAVIAPHDDAKLSGRSQAPPPRPPRA
jgi:hypothetical protein